MAMTVTTAATGLSTTFSFPLRPPNAATIAFGFPTTQKSLVVRASQPQREQQPNAFTSPEDLNYLWKLGVGSVVGGAAIKYGSILFPEITKPNILLALLMISAPVVVAVLLLIKRSRGP